MKEYNIMGEIIVLSTGATIALYNYLMPPPEQNFWHTTLCWILICLMVAIIISAYYMVKFLFTLLFIKILKPILLKRWSREISKNITTKVASKEKGNGCRNEKSNLLIQPYKKTWQEIYDEWPDNTIRYLDSAQIGRILRREYFHQLEKWLDNNCVGIYYCWTDSVGIYLFLKDEQDQVFYYLNFEEKLPPTKDMYNQYNT